MTLAKGRRHVDKIGGSRYRPWESHESAEYEWPRPQGYGLGYEFEEELSDQIYKLPSPEQIEEICSVLRVAVLRELSAEIVNGSIKYVKTNADRLEYVKLLNSWIATAEETVAAGRNVNRIAARRRKKSSY